MVLAGARDPLGCIRKQSPSGAPHRARETGPRSGRDERIIAALHGRRRLDGEQRQVRGKLSRVIHHFRRVSQAGRLGVAHRRTSREQLLAAARTRLMMDGLRIHSAEIRIHLSALF